MPALPVTPRQELVGLVVNKGFAPGQYALFFVSGEGGSDDPDTEDASGFLIDRAGAVYYFWLAWNGPDGRPAITEWEQVDPEPSWEHEREYRDARRRVGLEK